MKEEAYIKKPSKRSQMKNRLLELIESTTGHGIPRSIRTKHWPIRIFWWLCLSSALFFLCYISVTTVIGFLEYKVLVSLNVVREKNANFPAVTVCNLNPINYCKYPIMKSAVYDYFYYLLNEDERSLGNETLFSKHVCHKTTRIIELDIVDNFAVDKKPLYRFEEFILSCEYNMEECTQDDFTIYDSLFNGVCFTFNKGKNFWNNEVRPIKQTRVPGATNGLRLKLFVGNPDYQPCWDETSGALVIVHNQSTYPLVSQEGRLVEPGKETNFIVDRMYVNKLGSPYSNCIQDIKSATAYDSQEYKDTLIDLNGIYNHRGCLISCAYKKTNKQCMKNGNMTLTQLRKCITGTYNFEPYFDECFQNCPLECSSSFLSTTQSLADYPTRAHAFNMIDSIDNLADIFACLNDDYQLINDSIDLNENVIQKSIASVNVYYESIMYTEVNEVPQYTFVDILSSIGGQMGLFLGFSIMTFLEIVEIIYDLIYIGLSKQTNTISNT